MKIHFDSVNFTSASGPNTFASRLARQFVESGHELSDDGPSADASLVFISPSGTRLAKRTVQRLDGVWSKPSEFYSANKQIKSFYETTDAVVFQSEFDKRFVTHNWSVSRMSTVIHNGIKIEPVEDFTSEELLNLRSEYERIFVCSANWHSQKRLKQNTELFLSLRDKIKKKCCLLVLGSNPDYLVADPHVFYAGSLPESVYMQVYSMADWMLHLSWCDHCPNVVLESLSQGTPVVCSNTGGTREIVGGYGIIVDESDQFDYGPFDYDSPPKIDISNVNTETAVLSEHPDISIETCAKRYINLFENIL